MALHIKKGKEGERIAAEFLSGRGFEIVRCNWRWSRYEIDIIASKNGVLHFVEVKTRHSLDFGFPEEAVDRKKFSGMKKAACAFLYRHRCDNRIQFDILSIIRLSGCATECLLIEDVYL